MKKLKCEIRSNSLIQCEDQTRQTLDVYVDGSLSVDIKNIEGSTGMLVINLYGNGEVWLNITLLDNSILNYLWVNYSNESLHISENIILKKNSVLKANYAEFSSGNHKKRTLYELDGEKSQVYVQSANIVSNKIHWSMYAEHYNKNTIAQLNNYAIGLSKSDFYMKVVGHIYQGHKKSQTHQKTRVLNLFDDMKSVVLPELLIDENDVAASHACTMGQPNQEEIYYLQSRGLSKAEALKLVVLGYLLIVTEGIEDEDIKDELTRLIESKVENELFL